jgi:hypothetical protein
MRTHRQHRPGPRGPRPPVARLRRPLPGPAGPRGPGLRPAPRPADRGPGRQARRRRGHPAVTADHPRDDAPAARPAMHTSTHTALYDPDGLIEAELPLDREPYESLVDWTPPSPAAVRTRWISPPAPSPLPCPTCCGGPRRAALWADWERPDRARQGCPRVDRRGHTHDPRLRANRPPTDRPRPCHCLRRTTPRRPTAEGQRAQGARRRRPARGRRPTVRAAGGHRALRPGPRPDGACPVRAPGPPRGSRTAGTLEGPHPGFSGRGPVFRTGSSFVAYQLGLLEALGYVSRTGSRWRSCRLGRCTSKVHVVVPERRTSAYMRALTPGTPGSVCTGAMPDVAHHCGRSSVMALGHVSPVEFEQRSLDSGGLSLVA